MGRNKHPEQTAEKIVSAAARLFAEKGYEQTSIQDILDVLGLSKGGLYHHFSSKEEILSAVLQQRSRSVYSAMKHAIAETQAENSREKMKKIMLFLAGNAEVHALDKVMSDQVSDPHFVVSGLKTTVSQDAPIIAGLIEDGIRDGSLPVSEPQIAAEVFLLLLNIWINPVLFQRSEAETRRRLDYLAVLCKMIGLDVLDQQQKDMLIRVCWPDS